MSIKGLGFPISITQCDFLIDHIEYVNYSRPISHFKNEDATRNALITSDLIRYEMETAFGRPKSTILTKRGHEIVGRILAHHANNLVRAGLLDGGLIQKLKETSHEQRPSV